MPGVNVDYEVVRNAFRVDIKDATKSAFRDYIADDTKITDHSESRNYIEAGTKE